MLSATTAAESAQEAIELRDITQEMAELQAEVDRLRREASDRAHADRMREAARVSAAARRKRARKLQRREVWHSRLFQVKLRCTELDLQCEMLDELMKSGDERYKSATNKETWGEIRSMLANAESETRADIVLGRNAQQQLLREREDTSSDESDTGDEGVDHV